MSESSEVQFRHALHERTETSDNLDMWTDTAEQLEAQADEMCLVAQLLIDHVEPLRTVLNRVIDLHTTSTWEGNASTQSRLRLERQDDRCRHAVRTIDDLIDDLHSLARRNYG
jgi:hypothetical protein